MSAISIISAILLISTSTIQAQTAEAILTKYTSVTGGQENWANITSMKITGQVELVSQNMQSPFFRIMHKDGRQKTSIEFYGNEYIATAFDGHIAWGTNPQMQPDVKGKDETHSIKASIDDFPYPGFNWKARGYEATLLGDEVINEIKTHKIKLTKLPQMINGVLVENVLYLYIDVEKYIPVLTESMVMSGPNKGQLQRSYLSDYRSVEGFLYPFLVTMKYEDEIFQILQTEKVEWNSVIADSEFEMPSQ